MQLRYLYIWQYSCVKTVYPRTIVYLWLTNTKRMTHLEVLLNKCPVSNPVIIVSWFLLRLSNSPAFFTEGAFFLTKALSLPLSTYGLPTLMIPACTVPDHSPGNLCRYTKCRLGSYEWMWEAFSGWLISYFISINPHVSHNLYQLNSVTFCQLHQGLTTMPQ